jgi:hypothetical protein
MPHRVRVWDLPTRLFHWLLVISVIGLVITGHVGGNAMDWHARIGYAVFALLLFRIVWGFIGGHWSQFRSFLYGRAASGLPGGRAIPTTSSATARWGPVRSSRCCWCWGRRWPPAWWATTRSPSPDR